MNFTWPALLWLLLLVPALLGLRWVSARRRRRTADAFADAHLLARLARSPGGGRLRWVVGFQLAALACLVLAAGRPVAAPNLPVNQAAVVIAFDASRSMLADDVGPNRLEVARELAVAFVEGAPRSTRIGLVTFSDGAAALVPPTTERAELLEALARVEPAMNTSLTAAVLAAVRALPGREGAEVPTVLAGPGGGGLEDDDADKVEAGELPPARIILFSDGGDNVSVNPELPPSLALELAGRFADDLQVPVYTVPVGRDGGAVSRIDDQLFFVPFDAEPLQRLADLSGGLRLEFEDAAAVAAVFRELGTAIRWEAVETEVSSLFAAGGVALMLIAGGLGLGAQRRVP